MSKLQRWLRCVGPYSRYDGCNVKNITGGLLVLNRLSPKDIKFLSILAKTPEDKSALDEYIEQHEKAVKAYKIYRESVVVGVEVEKVVKPVETKRKFKAGDKVRVLKEVQPSACGRLSVGDVSFVIGYKEDFLFWEGGNDPVNIQPVIVKDGTTKLEFLGSYFEESALELVEEKTPNELRAEIIGKAKDALNAWKWVDNFGCDGYRNLELPTPYNRWVMVAEFVVNTKKRTVVALLKGHETLDLATKGIAKCSPGDVYNEHIGKAIALGRALGKDVSEFENAVQPTVAIGQEIEVLNKWTKQRTGAFLMVDGFLKCGSPTHDNGTYTSDYKITNDTNAQYEESVEYES